MDAVAQEDGENRGQLIHMGWAVEDMKPRKRDKLRRPARPPANYKYDFVSAQASYSLVTLQGGV